MPNFAGRAGTNEVRTVAPAFDIADRVHRFPDRLQMGRAAAQDAAATLIEILERQPRVRMIFAAAPSQQTMLKALANMPGIAWNRVEAFHMDEYWGLDPRDPAGFGNWLRRNLFDHLPFAETHVIPTQGAADQIAADYASLVAAHPIDIVCLGIGVNGHIAFNDPPVADFEDPLDVKLVTLDQVCRQQQVDDGCFPNLEAVPAEAITLTVPRLLRAERLFAVVPGRSKREAVRAAIHGPVVTDCPASILRMHPGCQFYLDKESDPDAED